NHKGFDRVYIDEEGRGKKEEGRRAKNAKADEDHFETFWRLYPKRVAKQAALKAWRQLNPNTAARPQCPCYRPAALVGLDRGRGAERFLLVFLPFERHTEGAIPRSMSLSVNSDGESRCTLIAICYSAFWRSNAI